MSKTFRPLADLQQVILARGLVARPLNGERMTMAVVDLDPGAGLPEHHHANEQMGLVLTGSLTMRIGGEKRELRPGDTYLIPSEVVHDAVTGPDGATVIDVFAPVRADWEKLEHLAPAPSSRWP